VQLPNPDRAVIDDAKVRDYLLSPSHPVGRFKAVFFAALGFSQADWPALRDALLELARPALPRRDSRARSGRSSRSMVNCEDLQAARQRS